MSYTYTVSVTREYTHVSNLNCFVVLSGVSGFDAHITRPFPLNIEDGVRLICPCRACFYFDPDDCYPTTFIVKFDATKNSRNDRAAPNSLVIDNIVHDMEGDFRWRVDGDINEYFNVLFTDIIDSPLR